MNPDLDRHLADALAALPGLRTDHNPRELRVRIKLAIEQDWLCTWCEDPITPKDIGASRTHRDHIIPLCRGGPDLPWNVELLHERCNRAKRSRMTRRAYAMAAAHGVRVPPPNASALNRAVAAVMDGMDTIDRAIEDLAAAGDLVTTQAWSAALPYLYGALVQGSRAAETMASHGPAAPSEPAKQAA